MSRVGLEPLGRLSRWQDLCDVVQAANHAMHLAQLASDAVETSWTSEISKQYLILGGRSSSHIMLV
jgi:hypothetical protein